MPFKYIFLWCMFLYFSISKADVDVCTDQQEYALTNSAVSCTSCAGHMDTHLVHWFRFEDPNMLNFDSITGLPQGTLTQLSDPGHVAGKLGRALNLMDGNPLFTVSTIFFRKILGPFRFFQILNVRIMAGFQIPNLIYLITRYNNVVWLEFTVMADTETQTCSGILSLVAYYNHCRDHPADSNKMPSYL